MLRAGLRIFVSLWLLCGCLAAAAQAPISGALEITPKAGETVKLYSASKALVIGIDHYSEGWPKLSGAIKDAKAVAEALKLQGFEVTPIFDPTQDELERAFRDFFIKAGADPQARLFVWFAGHGHTIKNAGGDDEGYIVPRDAPSPLVSDPEFREKAISLRRFGEYMREARAKHVLAVFDSCFGGTVFNVARALQPPPAITHATALPVRQFISSGDADQEVSDDGTFRRLFIDALQGAEPAADVNRDGYLTGTGLGQFLYTKMTNLTAQRQTPRYGKLNALGYDRGDFVFQLREPKAASAPLPKTAEGPQAPVSEAAREWGKLENSSDSAVLEAFRKQFGAANPYYDMRAEQRIAALKEKTAAGGSASPWWQWGSGQKQEPAKPAETQTAIVVPKPETQTASVAAMPVPAPAAPAEPACDGLLVSVAAGKKPCIKPGSGEFFKDCPNCPEMVIVPAGGFNMGSLESEPDRESWQKGTESPQHRVRIAKPFAVGRYPVTFAEWDACVDDGGCGGSSYIPGDQGWGRGDRPVINVNWNDAKLYIQWLLKKTGKEYRLLSEAEREYVTRAGADTPFWWGSSITPGQANYDGSAEPYKGGGQKGDYRQKTLPVKSFKPNPWGLYQVHGNVWDWVEDCWKADYSGAPSDGSAVKSGNCAMRVLRGGSRDSPPGQLRSAYRTGSALDARKSITGFRVARPFE